MSKLNPAKSRHLRPLRIVLAGLIVILSLLVLNHFSLNKIVQTTKTTRTIKTASTSSADALDTPSESYLYLYDFLDLLESDIESRLASLGVPEEEFSNPGEYLDKDELFAFETKATLASELETNRVLATSAELNRLKTIFSLDSDFSFDRYASLASAPEEYKNLSDLLAEYDHALNTVEDYDEEYATINS